MRARRRRPLLRRQEQESVGMWGQWVRAALRELRPRQYRAMQESGDLDPYLRGVDDAAAVMLLNLLARGYQEAEANELLRERFLLSIDAEPGSEAWAIEHEPAVPGWGPESVPQEILEVESPTPPSPTRRTKRRLRLLDTTTESPPHTPQL